MNYIIYDLEATCWEDDGKSRVQEIIEIGAVKMDARGRVDSRFTSFVRPKFYPMLSDFCRRLTSITQIDINQAAKFPEVVEEFKEWIGFYDGDEYLLCSWGFFDQQALARDC
jgi:inhibitor of KinA sporulation pathway (predicted exonuclease)